MPKLWGYAAFICRIGHEDGAAFSYKCLISASKTI